MDEILNSNLLFSLFLSLTGVTENKLDIIKVSKDLNIQKKTLDQFSVHFHPELNCVLFPSGFD